MKATYQDVSEVIPASPTNNGLVKRAATQSVNPIKGSVIGFFKRLRRVIFQLIVHSLDGCYDLYRYLRYSNSLLRSTNDQRKVEALLFFYYHKIEKALALPEVKPLFGLAYLETILDLMDRWIQLTSNPEAIVFRGAYTALLTYREHSGQALAQAQPDLAQRLDRFLTTYKQANESPRLGGTTIMQLEEFQTAIQAIDFDRFVQQRHSVRIFTDRHIPDEAITHAVKLAQRSPSVCNRQCARVHVFSSAADKAAVLRHQNGNAGFGHLANRVLLITADLRSFITSGERNQGFIDAGLFTMTLLYALQAQGIASCCLNLSISFNQDVTLRRVSKIPAWETPIMMIAIGYPPESLPVAASARIPTESVLFFQNLDTPESSHEQST